MSEPAGEVGISMTVAELRELFDLRAENARLKDALKEIELLTRADPQRHQANGLHVIQRIAERATATEELDG